MHEQPEPRSDGGERRSPTRTCVGCGSHDDPAAMLRMVVGPDGVAFDLAGGSFGRGAHLHARPACIEKAPAGLSRSFRRSSGVTAAEVGALLVAASERRIAGLLLAAHRMRALAVGADASLGAMSRGAPLLVVAADAGTVAEKAEVADAVAGGRTIGYSSKGALGALLGETSVALCAVKHEGISAELKKVRAAADAGASVTREGAGCRRPEAR